MSIDHHCRFEYFALLQPSKDFFLYLLVYQVSNEEARMREGLSASRSLIERVDVVSRSLRSDVNL